MEIRIKGIGPIVLVLSDDEKSSNGQHLQVSFENNSIDVPDTISPKAFPRMDELFSALIAFDNKFNRQSHPSNNDVIAQP